MVAVRKALLPPVFLAILLGASACGGSASEEDKIVEVVETSATSTDPADCTALATQAFLEQAESREGEAAVSHCEKNNEEDEDAPDSVEVSDVEIDGSTATANAEFVGGDSITGQTFDVALVEEDGEWKMDEIRGFVNFDQEGLAVLFEEAVVEDVGAKLRPIARCVGDGIRDLSPSEAEDLVIGGSEQRLEGIFARCFPSE